MSFNFKVHDVKPELGNWGKLSSHSQIVVSDNGRETREATEDVLAAIKNGNIFRSYGGTGSITDQTLLGIRKCVMCTPEHEYIASVKIPLIQYLATQEESAVQKLFKDRDSRMKGTKQRVLLDGPIPTHITFSVDIGRVG